MKMRGLRVAVVGAGIIGMTSAVATKATFPDFEVHIFANEFSPGTTGDGSAGLWSPYLLGATPLDDVIRWAGSTHRWLESFWKSGLSSETGVSLIPFFRVTSNPKGYSDDLAWTKVVYGARKINATELEKLNQEHKSNYKDGWQFLTFTAEPVRLLPWLMEEFIAAGGQIQNKKINTMEELIDEGYDLIINCCGLGACELVGDSTVVPIRGQVSRVKMPWLKHGFLVDDDDGNYTIPNIDNTVLGGTHQENDFDRTPRKEDTNFILDGCYRMLPTLKRGQVLQHWVGLRPGRPRVRLELETVRTSQGRECKVIHNYGHGGSGVTVSWGCALDVVEMIRSTKKLKSNL